MTGANPYCEILGIEVPRLEALRGHPEANYYSLLFAALQERVAPITLNVIQMGTAIAYSP